MREKLIEILRQTRYEYRRYIGMKDMEMRMAKTEEEFCAIDDSIVGEIPFCADYLIANGVTIATGNNVGDKLTPTEPKWIPLSERLPENDQRVLCFMKDKAFGTFRVFQWNYIDWQWNDGSEWYDENDVTHWMQLPEPPKEG